MPIKNLRDFAAATNTERPPKKTGGKHAKRFKYSPPTPYEGLPAAEAFLTECRMVTTLAHANSPLEEALRQSILNVLDGDALKIIDPTAKNFDSDFKAKLNKAVLEDVLKQLESGPPPQTTRVLNQIVARRSPVVATLDLTQAAKLMLGHVAEGLLERWNIEQGTAKAR